jgi:hypothetical protein
MQKDWIPRKCRVLWHYRPVASAQQVGSPVSVSPAGSGCESGTGSLLPFARQLPVLGSATTSTTARDQ